MNIISRLHTKIKIMIRFPFFAFLFCRQYILHCSDSERTLVILENIDTPIFIFFFTIERNLVKARKYLFCPIHYWY